MRVLPLFTSAGTACSSTFFGILRYLCVWMLVFLVFLQTAVPADASLFGSFGIRDELEMGRKFDILVRSRMPLVEDPEVKRYVQSVVDRLADVIPPQPFTFRANVLLHNSLNAFAVPGGSVFVHTGLIMQLEHESELAGVLGHELAHVTQRHIATRIERAQKVSVGSLLGALGGLFLGGAGTAAVLAGSMAAGQSAMLNYSRVDETEADQMGFLYVVKAGYRPQGMQGAFEKIRRRQWISGGSVPEYLSTHPDVSGRITEVAARVKAQPASVRNRKEDDVRFNRVRTLIWARYGEPEAATKLFAGYLKKNPKNSLAIMGQALLAERRSNMREAENLFARALALAPADSLIVRETGRFYYSNGDNRAEGMLKQALRLAPDDLMAQFYYARLLSETGKRKEAHRYYESLLKVLPDDAELHYYYGRSLGENREEFRGCLHMAYSAMYQHDSKKMESWLKRAQSLKKTKQDEEELKKFDKIVAERRAVSK